MPAPPLERPVRYVGKIVDTNEPISDFSDSPSVSITIDVNGWGVQYIDRSLIPPSLRQTFEGGEFAWTCLLDEIDVLLKSGYTSALLAEIAMVLSLLTLVIFMRLADRMTEQTLDIMLNVSLSLSLVAILLSFWKKRRQQEIGAKIQKVLDDASSTQPQLSFLFMKHTLYFSNWWSLLKYIIEKIEDKNGKPRVKFHIYVYAKTRTETCLQDLEKTRKQLSDQEYEEKRRHILKDVTRLEDLCRMKYLLSVVEYKEIKQGIETKVLGQVVDQEVGDTHDIV